MGPVQFCPLKCVLSKMHCARARELELDRAREPLTYVHMHAHTHTMVPMHRSYEYIPVPRAVHPCIWHIDILHVILLITDMAAPCLDNEIRWMSKRIVQGGAEGGPRGHQYRQI